jgi:hypothetical protein
VAFFEIGGARPAIHGIPLFSHTISWVFGIAQPKTGVFQSPSGAFHNLCPRDRLSEIEKAAPKSNTELRS